MKKIFLGMLIIFLITGCEDNVKTNNIQDNTGNNNVTDKEQTDTDKKDDHIQDNTGNNNVTDKEQNDTDKKDDQNNYEEVTPERVENLFSIEKKVTGTNHVVKFIGFGDVYDNEIAEIYANILLDGKEILTQVAVGEYAWPFNKDEFKVELSSVHGNIMLGINLDRIGAMSVMYQPGKLLVIDPTGKILINETELLIDYSDGKRIEPIVVDDNSIILNVADNGGRRKYSLKNGAYVKTSLEAPDNWNPCCGY